jgi:hypothetical protein
MTGDEALDRFFESYYRLRPVNATFTGIHAHDSRLPDWSRGALDDAASEMRALRRTLEPHLSAHPIDRDGSPLAVDLALADAFLEIQLAELDGTHFVRGNPSLWVGEAIFSVIALVTRDFAPAEERVAAAVERLRAIPSFLGSASDTLARELPEAWTAKATHEAAGAAILLTSDGFRRWLSASVPGSLARDACAAAASAAESFGRFGNALATGHAHASDDRYACGAAMLELLVRRGHWCDRSLDALHDEARAHLDDAIVALDREARALAPGGWSEVQELLAERHPSADDYLDAYRRTWDACRARAAECDLVTWPDWPIRYVPIPEQTREGAPYLYYLFYRSPAPFDDLAVHDYVVTPIDATMPAEEQRRRLRATNQSVITLNHVVHHGAIGHHVQNWHAYHRAPSRIARVAAVDCASRIAMFSGGTMAEGWACYATELMEEVGFLHPLEQVAESHTRVRLLARAVVDLALHTRRISLAEAESFYVERARLAPAAAHAEAVKNSMFPGTALMYWLGLSGIRELRASEERRLGAAFSRRELHDRLLGFGSIPVPLIARSFAAGASA